jgi:copper resistance protein D
MPYWALCISLSPAADQGLEADPLIPWLLASRLGLYASSLLAAGLGLHAALGVVERDARWSAMRIAACAASVALVFSVIRAALVNAQLGGGIGAVLDLETFAWTWQALSLSTAVALGGALGVVFGWVLRSPWIAAIGSICFAASFALTGHSAALPMPGLAPWVVGLHVLIAAFWFSAPLILWPRQGMADATLALRLERFSAVAVWAIPVLFLLGLWLVWTLAGGVAAVFSTTYGQLLIAKFSVSLIALGLGAFNKLRLTHAIADGRAGGRSALKRTLLVEFTIFVIALLLVGIATTAIGPAEPF